MCLIFRRTATVSSFKMTLLVRLSPEKDPVEVGVPLDCWSCWSLSGVGKCPHCKSHLQVLLKPCGRKSQGPHSPQTVVAPALTCFPQSPIYSTPTSPFIPDNNEIRRLEETLGALRLSGWYYGNLDWQGARDLLKDASVGAFVVRNSGDTKFIFSLSVQTGRGPTSVRLHYKGGFFRLDCDEPVERYMPRFKSVVELVQHYTRLGQKGAIGTVWVDREGCPHSPVLLKTPLRKSPPTLLHAARLAIHKAIDSNPYTPKLWCAPKHRLLPLPSTLKDYLGQYPYSI